MEKVSMAAEKGPDISLISVADLGRSHGSAVILDARPRKVWQASHIPGSLSFSWETYTRTDSRGIPYQLLPPDQLATALGTMGIDATTQVMIYGDADKSWGGEGWAAWVLAWLGHTGKIRILDGGVQEWKAMGRAFESGDPGEHILPKTYAYHLRDYLRVSTDMIQKKPSSYQIVDTRSLLEWVMGRIPGAKRIEWGHFFTGPQRRPISPDSMRRILSDNGIDPARPVVYVCAGGIRSGYAWMVHQLAGLPSAMNDVEGMAAWDKLPHR
jgi:thiosulfate/3-mercaptopyruvate sulfurtransferase